MEAETNIVKNLPLKRARRQEVDSEKIGKDSEVATSLYKNKEIEGQPR